MEFPDEDAAEGRVSGTVTLHLPKLENVKSVVNSYLETVWVFSVVCLFLYSVYPSTTIIMVPWKMAPSNISFFSFRVMFHFHDSGSFRVFQLKFSGSGNVNSRASWLRDMQKNPPLGGSRFPRIRGFHNHGDPRLPK